MKHCDTCGSQMGDDHPFAICPECLFGTALRAHPDTTAVPLEKGDQAQSGDFLASSRLFARRDFFQKYEIQEKVAGGGQGDIWRVWDFELRRCAAMKRMSEKTITSQPAVYRFLAEAQIASQLEHPGILPIFDVGLDPDGRPYYTTQLLPGTTLEDVWRHIHEPTPSEWNVNRALELLLRICDVMGHAHSRGVIHRDLKPSNILIGAFGDVRVIDWGSAHVLESAKKNFEEAFVPLNWQTVETDRGRAMWVEPQLPLATAQSGYPGTLLFVPPEILAGKLQELGPATDIYSLGVMLYYLVTGRLVYALPDGSLPEQKELRPLILQGPPEPVRSVNRHASRDLAAICEKAMAHDKSDRYVTMEELAEDIRAALEIRPVRARKPTIFLKLQKWSYRNFSYVLISALAVVLVSIAFSLTHAFKIQRDAARQSTLVRNAELAARSGRWRDALNYWGAADAAGYRDKIYLGLQEAEAWTVLSEPEKSRAELIKLSRRRDLGTQRGAVLLRLGEHELFDEATANQGVQHVREAMASGLDAADTLFAQGLLADSTPEALNLFHRAIQIDSFNQGAQRHSLGLEFLLGRHAELQASLRFFAAIYPDDPSAGFLEAAELAMQGKLDEARARMVPLRASAGGNEWTQLNDSLPLFAAAAKRFDPDVWLATSHLAMPSLSLLTMTEQASGISGTASNSPVINRMPFLPSIQNGPLAGRAALSSLMVPFIGNIDLSVEQIKNSWQHHPEALVPAVAGIYLETRQPTNGTKSIHLLELQADLFQLAADSPSILAGLDRTSRYLAAKTEFELFQTSPTNAASLRNSCNGNIHCALSAPETSFAEFQAYFDLAMKLGDYDLARELTVHMETRQPHDPATLQARVDLEIAAGNLAVAWKLVNQTLAASPDNAQALANRETIQKKLANLNALINSPTKSMQLPKPP
jgi:serine/threonine protein kinase